MNNNYDLKLEMLKDEKYENDNKACNRICHSGSSNPAEWGAGHHGDQGCDLVGVAYRHRDGNHHSMHYGFFGFPDQDHPDFHCPAFRGHSSDCTGQH